MHLLIIIIGNLLAGAAGCLVGVALGSFINSLARKAQAHHAMENDNGPSL